MTTDGKDGDAPKGKADETAAEKPAAKAADQAADSADPRASTAKPPADEPQTAPAATDADGDAGDDKDGDDALTVGVAKADKKAAQAALAAAVGARPGQPERSRGRGLLYAVLAGVVVVAMAVTAVVSWLRSRDYYLVCTSDAVLAQRGRTWLWGRTTLDGPKWRPIQIPVAARCTDEKLATEEELAESFVRVLLAQANVRLQSAQPADVDEAERQLDQALLLTRAHPDRRGPIERLQGDVEYWRAAAEVQAAVTKLGAAADRFEAAAKRRPTLKTDAPAWSAFARYLADEIRKGPPGLRPVTAPPVGPQTRPPFIGTGGDNEGIEEPGGPGVAVPVGPVGPPRLPGAADAGPPPTDAGAPAGGILL